MSDIEAIETHVINATRYSRIMWDNIGLRFSYVDAMKNYTAQLNWTRPRGHKIGWRKLSRRQKQCAVLKAVLDGASDINRE